MTDTTIKLGKKEEKKLHSLKVRYGFKNNSDIVNFLISRYEEKYEKPGLNPEFVKEVNRSKKISKKYDNLDDLEREIEDEAVQNK